jgi:RNA polymerase-associated protein LEO1
MSTRELFGDDSSSEEEAEKQEEPPKKPSIYDDDDDDDDDDAVFNDQGAVVGLKSTTLAGSKAPEEAKEEPEEEEDLVDPRSLLVQQITSRPSDEHELFMTKLPNLVGLQTQAFDTNTFSPEQEEDEFGPQSAYNLMRWRYNDAGDKRESNTRMVQWDDGSWTLHVGKEAFEVDAIDSSDAAGFAGMNGYLYLSQKASFVQTDEDETKTTTPAGTVLECLGAMKSRMIVRPSSLQSDAHKSLTVAVRSKTTKRARIAQFMTMEDPEKLKEERIKVKADLDKVAQRKKGRSSGGAGGGTARRPRMSKSYLDDEEDDRDFDTTNIKAMKRGAYDREHPDYEDDYANYEEEEDEEDETFQNVRSKRQKGAKKSRDNEKDDDEDEDDEVVFGGDDDDDDDVVPVVKATKKRPTQSLFDDDSD